MLLWLNERSEPTRNAGRTRALADTLAHDPAELEEDEEPATAEIGRKRLHGHGSMACPGGSRGRRLPQDRRSGRRRGGRDTARSANIMVLDWCGPPPAALRPRRVRATLPTLGSSQPSPDLTSWLKVSPTTGAKPFRFVRLARTELPATRDCRELVAGTVCGFEGWFWTRLARRT